jgi:hypothetical protein
MAGTKKINKSQARQTSSASTNAYDVIAGIDGNPKSPTEHDANPAYHDELFFQADENATDVRRDFSYKLQYSAFCNLQLSNYAS